MELAAKEQTLQGIAQVLVQEQYLSLAKACEYQSKARAKQQSLPYYLIKEHLFSGEELALLTARHFGLIRFDLATIDPNSLPAELLDEKLLSRHAVLPLFIQANHLFLATDDPSQQEAFREIQFHTGLPVKLLVVETDKLHKLLNKLINKKEEQNLVEYLDNSIQSTLFIQEGIVGEEDAPIVKFVNKILSDAIQQRASDIHFEIYEKEYRIRYRQDGVLIEIAKPPIHLASRIAARLKILAKLDIAERRLPQDGHFKMKLAGNPAMDFRVSSCPTVNGEKIVLRLLNTENFQLDIDSLGFNLSQKNLFLSELNKPQGMILVTGPTGSGKTVSLYAALNYLNTKERNLLTVEDPVEIKLNGINQVNVNNKTGLSFAKTLRAFLRQDPDIIMVGEIRDPETAEIAVKAAQTGHLVLSTLHTNSAVEAITRLRNLGIAPYNIADSLNLVIAQRLARRLCPHCKILQTDLSPQQLAYFGFSQEESSKLKLYKASGCPHCIQGYYGRLGIFEVFPVSHPMNQVIRTENSARKILQQAQAEKLLSLYQAGLEKLKAGFISLDELNRITINHE